ncbi:BON domain-containing protein [Roseateles cellulosilyticus]|uniref:BON domain-containing protein n=1 Tax=Pelomonas cellulosilytica TaxID=2906762 RepID=A0ABS8Y3W9_9BURK|nr:BON domain-containing protein [Pelomonas sp. P8]MCE4556740.1 BON domain-containing protein [Pelomonas sp. P8]
MPLRHWFSRVREPRSLVNPDGSLRVADAPPRPRGPVRVVEARRSAGVLAWLLALGAGAAIALVAVVALQDPRSLGTQLDDMVARVRHLGDEAGQSVAQSKDAAAEASREALAGVGTAIDDAGISTKVKAALAVDPALSAARIDVTTQSGVVRLDGPAPNAAAKERASVLAAAPEGVRGVDNRLVLPQPEAAVAVAQPAPAPR